MVIKLISKNKPHEDFIFPNTLWLILAAITVATILYHYTFMDLPAGNKPVTYQRPHQNDIKIINNKNYKRDF